MIWRAFLVASVAAAATPALAQHEGHGSPEQAASLPPAAGHADHRHADTAEAHSARGSSDGRGAAQPAPAQDHSVHSAASAGEAISREESEAPPAEVPAAQAPSPSADAHAGHDLTAGAPPIGAPPAQAFSGPENAADVFFSGTEMAAARRQLGREHGDIPVHRVVIERIEAQVREGRDRQVFDVQAWYGGDLDKLWLKAEGEGTLGEDFESARIQALWSHAINPWFDLQTGVRYDTGGREDRAHLVLGLQGLAPYWIEVEAAAFLSDEGDLTARLEAEHDVRLTQALILQPRAEIDFALQDMPAERIGSGISGAAIGWRLRYQVTPLVAPYLGVEYETSLGSTRDMNRAAGEDADSLAFLAGLRAWF